MPQQDEAAFQRWYAGYADPSRKFPLNPDPDDPSQLYDYRAAFRAGATPDASGHWPSDFKRPGHPNEIVGGFNTRTGERVPGTPRMNEADLVAHGWDAETAKKLAATKDTDTAMPQKPTADWFAANAPVENEDDWFARNAPPPEKPFNRMPTGTTAGWSSAVNPFAPTGLTYARTPKEQEEDTRAMAKVVPIAASGLAAALSGGLSIPAQMAIMGAVGGAGSAAQRGIEGGDAEEMMKAGLWGAGTGVVSGAVGGAVSKLGGAAEAIASPTSKTEWVPKALRFNAPTYSKTGQLFMSGRPVVRPVTTVTPPDLTTLQALARSPQSGMGGVSRLAAMGLASSPSAVKNTGSLIQAFAPGIPASVSALLALLNSRQQPPQTK